LYRVYISFTSVHISVSLVHRILSRIYIITMVNYRKVAFIFLLVLLPALISAKEKNSSPCKIGVSQKLTDSSNERYYTYTGTITNVGTAPVTTAILTASEDLHSVSGLTDSNDNKYQLPGSSGGIAVGSDYSFTFSVKKGVNVQWTSTLTCSAAATEAPVEKPDVAATSKHNNPTTAPTSHHTSAPTTARHTSAPTTSKQTSVPTTSKHTNAPATPAPTTAKATSKGKATAAPTSKATTAPKGKATSAPASSGGSGSSANGQVCPTGSWWAPAPLTTWQWQLTGTIDQSINVQMYDIDLFDNTAATISSLHAAGRTVICYFSTQYENWRPDAASFTAAVLGDNLDDWAGEKYVDIRSPVVRAIMTARMDLAVSKGCDGLEPDNVDGYEAKTGFPLTAADQIDFNTFIANEAHARYLSVGLKNDVDQATALEPYFDWTLNEQCHQYDECNTLNIFITKGKAVFNCEYSGSASSICPSSVSSKFSSLIKTLDLTAAITAECCTYAPGGCAADAAFTCITAETSRDVAEEVAV